jgi:hypothetical protein
MRWAEGDGTIAAINSTIVTREELHVKGVPVRHLAQLLAHLAHLALKF